MKRNVVFLALAALLIVSTWGAASEAPTATWVDEVIMVEEPSFATAITRLQVADIDLYANTISDPDLFSTVRADDALDYFRAFGSFSELTMNTVGPILEDGTLNPFFARRIREEMNRALDREYIAQELYGGLASPKFFVANPAMVDYSRVIETARALEIQYAPDLERATAAIHEEMLVLGADFVDGRWLYEGEPVVLKVVIRTEDNRLDVGDYVSSLMEDMGFTVDRIYRTSAEASPLVLFSDPMEGGWHLYTGGWLAPVVYRDQGHNFNQYFTAHTLPWTRFQALDPIPELEELSQRLYNKDYSTMEERTAVYSRALELGLQDSPLAFLVDVAAFVPKRREISVASDLAGHVAGTPLWASTLRRGDEIGGSITVAVNQILIEPWNPVAGSNWTTDNMAIRATMDRGIMVDPYTGLHRANRVERADVYVKEGLPVVQTLDWVDLQFVSEIQVPDDALVDWDAAEQRFITVAEKYPDGVTSLRMSRVHYPETFFQDAIWHDGSPVSLGDFMMYFILEFDRGKEASAIFDESHVSRLNTWLNSFRGLRIVSEDPFVFEYYSDQWYLDAEQNVTDMFPIQFNYGKGPWHTLALGVRAETAEELTFSAAKADKLDTEWLGFNAGPSLPILARHLTQAEAHGYLPYHEVLSAYISGEEIAERYANASAWYSDKGHFWIADGPMFLERAYTTEKTVHLKRNPLYAFTADRWDMFDEPRIAEVEAFGPARIAAGEAVAIEVEITFNEEPYALEHIQEVKYLVINARGEVAFSGLGVGLEDGWFEIQLTKEQTEMLPVGSNTVEVIVMPTLVGGASFAQHQMIVLP